MRDLARARPLRSRRRHCYSVAPRSMYVILLCSVLSGGEMEDDVEVRSLECQWLRRAIAPRAVDECHIIVKGVSSAWFIGRSPQERGWGGVGRRGGLPSDDDMAVGASSAEQGRWVEWAPKLLNINGGPSLS